MEIIHSVTLRLIPEDLNCQ